MDDAAMVELATAERVLRAALAEDLNAFIEFTFGVVRPGAVFRPNWHIEAIAHKLSLVERGEIKRLIITVPPRHLKSLSASVAFPAWVLGRNPSERVVAVSYSDILAKAHANDFRLVVNHPTYQAAFPRMRLSRETDRGIMTTMRGQRYTTSIEGTLAGLGGNLFIIDDPLKPGEAYSDAVRLRVIDWYRSTLLSRPDDKIKAGIVVVMQRIHDNDLVGHLIEQGGFDLLELPAIAPRPALYELGDGRTYERDEGELLHPEHESVDVLREIRREMGSIGFAAQYQQSPIPPGGTIIKRKWFKYYTGNPGTEPGDRIIISWDIALSERDTGDYSAGVVLLKRNDTFFVMEVVRQRLPFERLKRKILEVRQRYWSATLLVEDSPISRGLIQSLKEQDVSVIAVRPETDKRARLMAQSDLFEAGSVQHPKNAPWLETYETELLAFPGRHDDQVDGLTQGLAWARASRGGGGGAVAIRGHS